MIRVFGLLSNAFLNSILLVETYFRYLNVFE